jgi:hypothetical protein
VGPENTTIMKVQLTSEQQVFNNRNLHKVVTPLVEVETDDIFKTLDIYQEATHGWVNGKKFCRRRLMEVFG